MGVYTYIPPKLERVEIFSTESIYIISKSVMGNNTTSKRRASLQCPPTLSAGGRGKGEAEKLVVLAKNKDDSHFLNFKGEVGFFS